MKNIKKLKPITLLNSIFILCAVTLIPGCATKYSNPLLNHSINNIKVHEKGYLGPIGVGFLDAVCINLVDNTTKCASFVLEKNRNVKPGDTITGRYAGYYDNPNKTLGAPDAICEERGKRNTYYITGDGDITVGFDRNIKLSEIESIDIYTISEDCSPDKGVVYISINDTSNKRRLICSGTGHVRCSQLTIMENIK